MVISEIFLMSLLIQIPYTFLSGLLSKFLILSLLLHSFVFGPLAIILWVSVHCSDVVYLAPNLFLVTD